MGPKTSVGNGHKSPGRQAREEKRRGGARGSPRMKRHGVRRGGGRAEGSDDGGRGGAKAGVLTDGGRAVEPAPLGMKGEGRAVVEDIGEHHGADNAQNQQSFAAQGHATSFPDSAQINECAGARQHQQRENIFDEIVGQTEGLPGGKKKTVERSVKTATPQDQRPQQQHHKTQKDELVG